jgi:hypothetical protein
MTHGASHFVTTTRHVLRCTQIEVHAFVYNQPAERALVR